MTTTKVYAPNAGHTGVVAGVSFVDGVAEWDESKHPAAARYFRAKGFGVGHRPDAPTPAGRIARDDAPAKGAKVDDWRAYAVTQGATEDDAKAMTKDELIERYGLVAATGDQPMDSRVASEGLVQGGRLRDASVDPATSDFLAPVNAGKDDPHGPNVVSPEIHASGPAGIRPGEVHVGDPDAQDAAESALAESVLIDGEEHPAQPAADPETGEQPDVDRGDLGLSDPGSADLGRNGGAPAKTSSKASWQAYAIEQGADPEATRTMSRAELIERYGGGPA